MKFAYIIHVNLLKLLNGCSSSCASSFYHASMVFCSRVSVNLSQVGQT